MKKNRGTSSEVSLFWFRRDLRLKDNRGLARALAAGHPVLPIFIFDPSILKKLEDPCDARVSFIWKTLNALNSQLQKMGSGLFVFHDVPGKVFAKLCKEHSVAAVFCNHDYEPYATQRDEEVRLLLEDMNIAFETFKDQCIFEKSEVVKSDRKPYTVFTPYSKAWKSRLKAADTKEEAAKGTFFKAEPLPIMPLKKIGFRENQMDIPSTVVKTSLLKQYHKTRDYPAVEGTSKLGLHLRFGTVSVRQCVRVALQINPTWLNELIWREFFMQILWHFPRVAHSSFKPAYDQIAWRNDPDEFKAWCEGKTSYPLVDAGMRELNATGYMHNRVRMVTASFLTKHLLIDWRKGEAYFAKKLLDFDLSANNGNWQWAAGSGCDAAPYFRVFNPDLQQKKFDPELIYIKKWVPEFGTTNYAEPIVEHSTARARALAAYKEGLKK